MTRTNITVKDRDLWKWAKKRAVDLEFDGVSAFLFSLVEAERQRVEQAAGRKRTGR